MLRPSETLRPPQPVSLQGLTDSFYSSGHSKEMCHSPCKAFLLMISALHHAAGLRHKSSKGNWKELKPDCWVTSATRNLMGLITFQALS